MAQLMPLPLAVSRSSKIQIGFTFLVPAYAGYPGKEAVKWLLLLSILYDHMIMYVGLFGHSAVVFHVFMLFYVFFCFTDCLCGCIFFSDILLICSPIQSV